MTSDTPTQKGAMQHKWLTLNKNERAIYKDKDAQEMYNDKNA